MSQFVLDLINAKNNSSIDLSDVTFGPPEISQTSRNTKVEVSAEQSSPYSGSVSVRYNRLHIADDVVNHTSNDSTDKKFNKAGLDGLSELLPEINNRFDLKAVIAAEEIEELSFAADTFFENGKEYIKLKLKPNSYHYIGEVNLELFTATIPLSDVVLDDELDGLIYPFP